MKPQIHIGVVPVRAPDMSADVLEGFARRVTADIGPVLENATGASWSFHLEVPHRLASDEPRGGSTKQVCGWWKDRTTRSW